MSWNEEILKVNDTKTSVDVPEGAKCYQEDTFKCPFIVMGEKEVSPCMENSGAISFKYVRCTKFDNWDIGVSVHNPQTAWNKLDYCESGFIPQDKRDDEKEIAKNEKLYKLKNPNEPFHKTFSRHLFGDCPVSFRRFGKHTGIKGWGKDIEYKEMPK